MEHRITIDPGRSPAALRDAATDMTALVVVLLTSLLLLALGPAWVSILVLCLGTTAVTLRRNREGRADPSPVAESRGRDAGRRLGTAVGIGEP